MKENTKVQETMEQEIYEEFEEIIENTEVEEKKPGKLAKVGGFMKKHGKKIAIGAGVALAGAAVFVAKALLKARAGEDADLDFIDDLEGIGEESVDDDSIIDIPAEDVEISE